MSLFEFDLFFRFNVLMNIHVFCHSVQVYSTSWSSWQWANRLNLTRALCERMSGSARSCACVCAFSRSCRRRTPHCSLTKAFALKDESCSGLTLHQTSQKGERQRNGKSKDWKRGRAVHCYNECLSTLMRCLTKWIQSRSPKALHQYALDYRHNHRGESKGEIMTKTFDSYSNHTFLERT